MFGSLRLGTVFGIDTYVHGTFWLLPAVTLLGGALGGDVPGAAGQVLFLFAVFGCVALHEVGHALAAAAYGIRTHSITLYPVGGVARLERMPRRPGAEIVIALAGPAVNLAIAAGLFAGLAVGDTLAGPESAADPLGGFLGRLLEANVMLLAFNLIPAFPMDGGRVLRAALSLGLPRLDATRAAVGVGSVLAVAGGVYALVSGHLLGAAVAVVVYLLGRAELAAVRAEERRRADTDVVRVWDATRGVWVEWYQGERPARAGW